MNNDNATRDKAIGSFIQLSPVDCTFCLELIETMDSSTFYTQRQRGFTIPKLKKILADPFSVRLAFQDVDYLLDLLDDDELEETAALRDSARNSLLAIQELQQQKFEEQKDINTQRSERRLRRLGSGGSSELAKVFQEKRTK